MEITIEQERKERKKILQTDEKPQCIYITCKKLKKKKKSQLSPLVVLNILKMAL